MLLEVVNLTTHTHTHTHTHALALPAPLPQVLSLPVLWGVHLWPHGHWEAVCGETHSQPSPQHLHQQRLHPRGSFAVAWQMWVIPSAKVDNSNINQAKEHQTKAHVPASFSTLIQDASETVGSWLK